MGVNTILSFDKEFDSLLVVNKFWYKKIVDETRKFYKVYVAKCNEHNYYMNFFEVLYAYLIGYGFRRKKIEKYIGLIRDKIIAHLKESCPEIADKINAS